ncbi:MAG: hypothetical protein HZC41_12730 [Chloroflexi bacterium]|nr:hypothetical protein [Chloroflexota bacterium]
MSDKPVNTSWMWKEDDGSVWGLVIHTDEQTVEWYDSIGCACDDGFQEQTFDDFLAKGPRYGTPPDDVVDEVYASIHTLRERV